MSLASILVMLTAVLGLYSNPQISQNASLKAQVDSLAAQAIQQATVALSQPTSTPIGEFATSSPVTVTLPDSNTPSSTPITVTVNPPAQPIISQPEPSQPVLGSAPVVINPIAPQLVQNEDMIGTSTLDFIFSGGSFDSLTFWINNQSYNITAPNQTIHVTGLQPAKFYAVCETVSLNGVKLLASNSQALRMTNNSSFATYNLQGNSLGVNSTKDNTVYSSACQ